MTINEEQDKIIDELNELEDWLDKYSYLICLAGESKGMNENLKTNKAVMYLAGR